MWSFTWVVKASKFCNLRCAYCYEWDELGNRARMTHDTWLGVLQAAHDYHQLAVDRGLDPRSSVILHGGEPLTLPFGELGRYCNSFSEKFGHLTDTGEFRLGIQTNLFHLTDRHVELFREHRMSVGVSFDAVPGTRLSLAGRPTEDQVRRNMARLAENGVRFGMITVLARHTIPHLPSIYEWVVRQGIPWRVLPLFDGPDTRDDTTFAVQNAELVQGMCDLFDRWFADGASHPIDPLTEYLRTAVIHLAGIRPRLYDRATDGDGVIVVNVDGSLFRVVDGYDPELAWGNAAEQTLAEILGSPAYLRSLDRDAAEREDYCTQCPLAGPCSGWHIFEAQQVGTHDGHCPVAYPVLQHICRHLAIAGYERGHLRTLMGPMLQDFPPGPPARRADHLTTSFGRS